LHLNSGFLFPQGEHRLSEMQKKMTTLNHQLIAIAFLPVLLLGIASCKDNKPAAKRITNDADSGSEKIKAVFHKPPSSFQDTMKIQGEAAVFYAPDEQQLEKIKRQTNNPGAFGASNSEYVHMMENARKVIRNTWPALQIVDAKNYRYILFIKKDGGKECIDLDKYDDMDGLFVFDGKKSAMLIDAMNVETEVGSYLNP